MSATKKKEEPAPEVEVEDTASVATEETASGETTETSTDEAGRGETTEASAEEAAAEGSAPRSEEEESYKVQYLRLRADFDNFRKRTRREKEEWTQRCLENLCSDLLTVLDHYDLGLENATDIGEETLKGFQMVRDQLGSTLGKYGLAPVEVEGGAFDPNRHEAITHMPSTEVPEGDVVAMTRKGYLLGNRLLRPAQVVVSAGGEVADEPANGEADQEKD